MVEDIIRFRKLEKDQDLLKFSQMTKRYIGVNYPLEYLRRSHVIAMTTKRSHQPAEAMLGGYILAMEGPFRAIQQLPSHVLRDRPDLLPHLERAQELTGLWIHPKVRNGGTRFLLWWNLFMDVLKQNFKGRPYLIYAYDAEKEKLRQMYSLSNPRVIYKGMVFIEGMEKEAYEAVEIGSIRSVLACFVIRPVFISKFITRRLFRKKKDLAALSKA
ncbi:MAG: hypothetical protein KF802_06780 [Bdellovibrionaceae bacterium]|nr:hypothetical protein [Pseudobdellovibrionaceae bacterium]MBX3034390.1 hypothetical protein [Pseudobdellovibrionaceae bacterium]